jgi:hypothetical protein
VATTKQHVDRVTYRWDVPYGVEPGWYCEAWDGDRLVADSQKIFFGVDVDDYEDSADLEEALRETFPGAEIVGL